MYKTVSAPKLQEKCFSIPPVFQPNQENTTALDSTVFPSGHMQHQGDACKAAHCITEHNSTRHSSIRGPVDAPQKGWLHLLVLSMRSTKLLFKTHLQKRIVYMLNPLPLLPLQTEEA